MERKVFRLDELEVQSRGGRIVVESTEVGTCLGTCQGSPGIYQKPKKPYKR